jgi:hypothetical protein
MLTPNEESFLRGYVADLEQRKPEWVSGDFAAAWLRKCLETITAMRELIKG